MIILLVREEQKEIRRELFYKKNTRSLKLPFVANLGGMYSPNKVAELVFAPLMLSFTIWVIQQAKGKGIKSLFFLARDAYPSFIIAKKICEAYDLNIDCKYFYCSRYSLRIPMYSENIDDALDHVCRGGIDVSFRKIMIRSGFSNGEIKRLETVFQDIDFDEIIPYPKLPEIRKILSSHKEYLECLIVNSKEKWRSLANYFNQNGLLTHNKIAIVDSGWTGTTQRSINHIRKRCRINDPVEGFYFGLFEIPKDCDRDIYHTYYFGPKAGFFNKVFFSNCLFEVLFHANHGTTMGYTLSEKAEPIFTDYKLSNVIENINNTICVYADSVLKDSSANLLDLNYERNRKILSRSLSRFMWNPTRDEADFFGQLMFSDDLLDESLKQVAPIVPETYLKENHFINKILTAYGIRKKHIHEIAWYEASAVRSGHHSLLHRCSYSFYKALSYLKKGI